MTNKIMNNDDNELVVYMQCPNCKKGWYAKEISYDFDTEAEEIKSYMVEGWEPTDISKELTCLNCGHKYTPVKSISYNWLEGIWQVESDMIVCRMWRWVAELLTTITGK